MTAAPAIVTPGRAAARVAGALERDYGMTSAPFTASALVAHPETVGGVGPTMRLQVRGPEGDVLGEGEIGVDHRTLGQEVKAFVVPAPGCTPSIADVRRFVGQALAPYKVPAYVEFRDSLPYSATGKLLRRELEDSGRPHGLTGSSCRTPMRCASSSRW